MSVSSCRSICLKKNPIRLCMHSRIFKGFTDSSRFASMKTLFPATTYFFLPLVVFLGLRLDSLCVLSGAASAGERFGRVGLLEPRASALSLPSSRACLEFPEYLAAWSKVKQKENFKKKFLAILQTHFGQGAIDRRLAISQRTS